MLVVSQRSIWAVSSHCYKWPVLTFKKNDKNLCKGHNGQKTIGNEGWPVRGHIFNITMALCANTKTQDYK